jgi:glycosyltransferase involved in cell wall biosynthesis
MDSGYSSLSKSLYDVFNSENWALKNADLVDFLSYDLCTYITQKIKFKKTTILSVTSNSFIDYTNYFPEYPKQNLIIFLARLEKIKNPILLLEAIELVMDKMADFKLMIFGEGTLEYSIKNYVQNKRMSNVTFSGKTYKPWEYLRKSKIFISIQENNNYPSQSLLEAMACENAIIASDVGETRMLVSDKEGILVKLDKFSISNAIIYLIEKQAICSELGKNARQKALKDHTMENFVSYFYSLEAK